jgi:hypothetical protein
MISKAGPGSVWVFLRVVCVGNGETDLDLASKLEHAPPKAAKHMVGHALACHSHT